MIHKVGIDYSFAFARLLIPLIFKEKLKNYPVISIPYINASSKNYPVTVYVYINKGVIPKMSMFVYKGEEVKILST